MSFLLSYIPFISYYFSKKKFESKETQTDDTVSDDESLHHFQRKMRQKYLLLFLGKFRWIIHVI